MSDPPAGVEGSDSGRRRRLSSGDIVDATVALIDTDGLDQVTMRRIGSALDVEAMALYRYFPSRRLLLDAVVDSVVTGTATDPELQMVAGDDWRDYLDRLAHGIRRMALTHPRLFPLIATHPTEAPWLRPPIRSLRWVDAFLAGLQDHHFPPPAAVAVYKQFSTFLLGHLLLEVSALGLDHAAEASAPPVSPDADAAAAHRDRVADAGRAAAVMDGTNAPSAHDIVHAVTPAPRSVVDEPAVAAALPAAVGASAATASDAVVLDVDVPVITAMASTQALALTDYPHVAGLAGLLARDTAGIDFDAGLGALLSVVAELRRP